MQGILRLFGWTSNPRTEPLAGTRLQYQETAKQNVIQPKSQVDIIAANAGVAFGSGGRLDALMTEISDVRGCPSIESSHVGMALGHEDDDEVLLWLAGVKEIPFKEREKLASIYGASPEWIVHGQGAPFLAREHCVTTAQELLKYAQDGHPTRVSIIRSDCDWGYIAIVRQFDDFRYDTLWVNAPFSVNGGSTSENWRVQVMAFCQRMGTSIHGYILDQATFDDLIAGRIHAGRALRASRWSPWPDDIWDVAFVERSNNEHFKGFRELVANVNRLCDSYMPELRAWALDRSPL